MKYKEADEVFFQKLAEDYPEFRFRIGRKFSFRPPKYITIGPPEAKSRLLVLHEVGHALSGHKSFGADAERLKMEVEAWEKAQELAEKYGVEYDEETVQGELDSYRDWLHQKSRCPKCGLTRFGDPHGRYFCPRCDAFRKPKNHRI